MTTVIISQVNSELGLATSQNICDVTENVNTDISTISQRTEENCEKMETRNIDNIINNVDEIKKNYLYEDTSVKDKIISEHKCDTETKVDLDNETHKSELLNEKNLEINDLTKEDDSIKMSKKKRLLILDSDSEEENIFLSTTRRQSSAVNEDDSDSKDSINSSSKTAAIMDSTCNKKKLLDSDSEDDNENTTFYETNDTTKQRSLNISDKLRKLLDSDSEDENNRKFSAPGEIIINEPVHTDNKAKYEKKKKGSIRASKDEAMKQIHSETQRLLREREISLPYHRPKQRTLKEFLNRKKVTPLPQAPSTAVKLKMASEILSKALEEKEKEAEEFYKSSDSEDEMIKNTSNDQKDEEANKNSVDNNNSSDIEKIGIEETQNGIKNDIQNVHNEKEVLEQDSINRPTASEDIVDEKQVSEGHDLDLKLLSVPRKLFNESPVMDMEFPSQDDNHSQGIVNESNQLPDFLFSNDIQNTNTPTINETLQIDKVETVENKKSSNNIFSQKKSQDLFIDFEETQNKSPKANGEGTVDNENEKSTSVYNCESTNDTGKPEGHVLGLPLPDIEEDKPLTRLELKKKILSSLPNIKPMLKGTPGSMIDLSNNFKPNRQGINTLIDRFFKHNAVATPTENTDDVTVIQIKETADGLMPVKESLPYKAPLTKNEDPELSKPGAKLLRLKEDLKLRMAMKRNEEWKEKEKQQKLEEEEGLGDDIEEENDCLKKLNEEEEDNELSESGESEPEEDDMPIKERKKTRCDFGDEEAEVSGEEEDEDDEDEEDNDNEEIEENDADEEEEEGMDGDAEDECEKENSEDENEINGNNSEKEKRKFRRIVTSFDEETNGTSNKDSDDEENSTKKTIFERSKTDVDMFESCNGNDAWSADNDNTAFQSNVDSETTSQHSKSPILKSRDIFSFVSPITQLTALKCPDSAKKTPNDTKNVITEERMSTSAEKTPIRKLNLEKKKLFDFAEASPNKDKFMQLSAENLSTIPVSHTPVIPPIGSAIDISESQLMNLCSGTFSAQTNCEKKSQKNDARAEEENTQDFKLFVNENSESSPKKVQEKQKRKDSKNPWSSFRMDSSDEEKEKIEQISTSVKKFKKKQVKKLDLSDEEEMEDDENLDEEEEAPDFSDEENDDDEEKYLDYDSDENEIIVTRKTIKKVAAGFVENEAELSESEWGSADEDEKDLDKLEMEEGDNEEIDENQMKNQLEKIHMRQLLDEDQREVRLLKELLFEDGDLHTDGSGRERKFKWRNVDKVGADDDPRPVEDVDNLVDLIEDENDIEQIKLRREREKFLRERKKESDDDLENELGDSEIFKFGMKALKKINKSKSKKEDETSSSVQSEDRLFPQTVSDILNSKNLGKKTQALYRHSLLARGEETLARIAKIVKETDVTSVVKKSGKFCVFKTISPVKNNTKENEEEEEQFEKSSSDKKHRKRKALKGATPRSTKKSKLEENEMIRKTLFD